MFVSQSRSVAVIGLERNGQAEDPVEANTVRTRILKNRFSGQLGIGSEFVYDVRTGRLDEQVEEPTKFEAIDGTGS